MVSDGEPEIVLNGAEEMVDACEKAAETSDGKVESVYAEDRR